VALCTIDIRVYPATLFETVRPQALPRLLQPPSLRHSALLSALCNIAAACGSTREAFWEISHLPIWAVDRVPEPIRSPVDGTHSPAQAQILRLMEDTWQQGDAHQDTEQAQIIVLSLPRSCSKETRSQDRWYTVMAGTPHATSSPVPSLRHLLKASLPAPLLLWTTL